MLSQRLASLQPVGIFVMRVALGGIVLAYTVKRLSGGMAAFTSVVTSLGLPRWLAPAASWIELLAAAMLIIGLQTRLAAAVIFLFMAIGVRIHLGESLSSYDAYLSHAVMALALVFFGAGPWSIDNKSRPASGRRR
ncbi:MAG TPA: DoxX family protein [Terriglobales bacterium]|nr:DoxX family protein [Terriglobales bacterium]